MLLLSPGLALFLYGVSSIPEAGAFLAWKVGVPATVGLLMIIGFVLHSFRPTHPLVDLRLFRHRNLTVAALTMFIVALAFFDGLLIVPTYSRRSAVSRPWTPACSWQPRVSARW